MQRGNPQAVSFSSTRVQVASSASWPGSQHGYGARGAPAESEVKERKCQVEGLWLFTGGLCRNAETNQIVNQCSVSCGASGIHYRNKLV